MSSFDQLGLSPNLLQNITNLGYQQPLPIQSEIIPPILDGKDIMGIAQTGAGKTASFVLPILEKIQYQKSSNNRDIAVLVLAPTRELAIQIHQVFKEFKTGLRRDVKIMAVYGGVSINPQMKAMMGVEILIATPGRLLDLMQHNSLSLKKVEVLVVDEADKMFQLGFEEEMRNITTQLPAKRQNLLFSATLNDKVTEMKAKLSIDPVVIEIKSEQETEEHLQIEELAYSVTPETKGPFLRQLIKTEGMKQVLIFVSSTRSAENLVVKLKKNGIRSTAIHGDKTQGARTQALDDFKNGKITALVATDLIGRGIHIEKLPYVINFELPRSPLDYVHRIGRTGRANESGVAISLITPEEEHHFNVIQKKAKKWITLESAESYASKTTTVAVEEITNSPETTEEI